MSDARAARPWKTAIAWLIFLGPFFFLTYGTANTLAAARANVPSIVFDWERHLPFWDWSILPYWSIDVLYGASLFVCATRAQLNIHVKRLISAQLIAVACFLLFPLTFSFERPSTSGWAGELFTLLAGFDKPFNQAPSLHIALLVSLWVLYEPFVRGAGRWLLHAWFALIGVSVLTTYQHHFFDVPTGMLLGWLCVWAWPEHQASPWADAHLTGDARRRALALRYGAGAAIAALLAMQFGGGALWLFWPAVSLLLVALCYLLLGPRGFQKRTDGALSPAATWLYAPYLLGAWINSRWWTRNHEAAHEIVPGVWLGRLPGPRDALWSKIRTVIDMSAEVPLSTPRGSQVEVIGFPTLDLTMPRRETLEQAVGAIEAARHKGPVLVCCALGYSRSALAVAAWMLRHGEARDVAHALQVIARARPAIVLGAEHRATLEALYAGA
ncbi:phosphatase PAP2/dual specificity phosphatase family protein [Thiobacter aerophilum]|uniref:Phosphatase PAP2/dual specificity phosphatase family protein n=1 Tax=Thiobacter aerophilum TaxID=3121275 RepID=A0ABV0EDU7_9BURK